MPYETNLLLVFGFFWSLPAFAEYLGNLSANEYDPNSTANQYGAGSPYSSNSVTNEFGLYGSPYSNQSATNPYATAPHGSTIRKVTTAGSSARTNTIRIRSALPLRPVWRSLFS